MGIATVAALVGLGTPPVGASPLASATYVSAADHYSFRTPEGWQKIPKSVIDEQVSKQLSAGEAGAVAYTAGFQAPADQYFTVPFLLVQQFQQPGMTIDQVLRDATDVNAGKTDVSGVQSFTVLGSTTDPARGLVQVTAEIEGDNGGAIRVMSANFVGSQGVTQLNLYHTEDKQTEQTEIFDQLVASFQFDPGYGYNQATPTASADTTDQGVDYGRVVILVLAVTAVVAIFGFAVVLGGRRRDRRGTLSAEARIRAMIEDIPPPVHSSAPGEPADVTTPSAGRGRPGIRSTVLPGAAQSAAAGATSTSRAVPGERNAAGARGNGPRPAASGAVPAVSSTPGRVAAGASAPGPPSARLPRTGSGAASDMDADTRPLRDGDTTTRPNPHTTGVAPRRPARPHSAGHDLRRFQEEQRRAARRANPEPSEGPTSQGVASPAGVPAAAGPPTPAEAPRSVPQTRSVMPPVPGMTEDTVPWDPRTRSPRPRA